MSRIIIMALLAAGLMSGGCRPKNSAPAVGSGAPPPPPPARVAVLLFEDNLDFSATDAPGAGQAVYRAQIEELTEALRQRGVSAETLRVAPAGVDDLDLSGYGAALVVDTFMIQPETRTQLESFVQQGGVLVGVYEVGRFPGAWVDPWPFADLFGVRAKIPSVGGAGVLEAPPEFYRSATIVDAASPLVSGLTNSMDWGPAARHVWPVEPAGATVVASFPHQMVLEPNGKQPTEVAESLPAVTDHRVGRGRAIFVSVLPSGRQFKGWEQAADAVTLLANAAKLATPVQSTAALRPLSLTLSVNQLGYAPGWPRTLVVRARGGAAEQPIKGQYQVRTEKGDPVAKGELKAWPTALWHSRFATADLSGVREPGAYQLSVTVEGTMAETPLRVLGPGEISAQLHRVMESYLESIRCGETCHHDAPIAGGVHAGTDDSTVRLEDMLELVSALTRMVEADPNDQRMRFELERAVMWCWRMRGDDGMPTASVRPVGEAVPGVTAKEDRRPRELEKKFSVANAARYAAVMARAVKPVRDLISLNLGQEITVAAEQAYLRICKEPLTATADIGDRLWAAVEVYRASYQPEYLEEAKRDASLLYARQVERERVPGTSVYGDFYADGEHASLSPLQFERHLHDGLYFGLMELYRQLPDGTGKDDLRSVLDRFTQGFLVNAAALSPYGQFAAALEPMGPPRPGVHGGFEPPEHFQVRWFSYRGSPVGETGLNAEMLTLAAVALEWARETGRADLEQAALQQVNWLLGVNPLGLNQLAEEHAVPCGITGRADHPVWSDGSAGRGAVAPNAALISILADLPNDLR